MYKIPIYLNDKINYINESLNESNSNIFNELSNILESIENIIDNIIINREILNVDDIKEEINRVFESREVR